MTDTFTCITQTGSFAIDNAAQIETLRACLRRTTAASHERLDRAMSADDEDGDGAGQGWSDQGQYARFLSVQYGARQPVEAWLTLHAPAGLRPPEQCPLIARDLDALGVSLPVVMPCLALADIGEDHVLGAAWVLAGSALGNRSILGEVRREGHGHWPTRFLADESMLGFWQSLRPIIEEPASEDRTRGACAGATAIFDHFIEHAEREAASGSPQNQNTSKAA